MSDSNTEINILLPYIQELVEEYERQMIANQIKGSFDLSQIDIASKALHHDPLSEYEFALRSRMMGAASTEEIVNFMMLEQAETEQQVAQYRTAAHKYEKPFSEKAKEFAEENLYFECDIVDKDGQPSNDWLKYENLDENTLLKNGDLHLNSFLDDDVEKVKFKRRITNEVKWKRKNDVSKAVDKLIGTEDGKWNINGKDFNAGIEQCFNCFVKIDLHAVLPALEFVFDFSKLINAVKALLLEIERNLNPLEIFNQLCNFSLGIGENLLCPANMQGINLLLPTLFVKYSLDLMNLRFDPMSLLGNVISGVVKGITSWVENLPRLVVPFIDCFINATKTTFGYIRAIANSLNKISQEVLTSINQVATSAHKLLLNTLDFIPGYNLETLKEEKESLKKEIDSINNKLNETNKKSNISKKVLKELQKAKIIISFVEAIGKYLTLKIAEEKTAKIDYNEYKNYFIDLVENPSGSEEIELSTTFNKILSMLDEESLNSLEELQKEYKELLKEKKEELQNKKSESLENKMASNRTSIEVVGENSRYISENTSAGFWEGKYRINSTQGLLNNKGKKRDMRAGRYSSNANYKRPASEEFTLSDYLFGRYGIDINQNYTNYEYGWISGSKKFVNDKTKSFNQSLSSIENILVKNLQAAKQAVLDITNKIILTFKNLDAFLSENVNVQFKILGEIQNLLHLIRLFRVINELIQNGFSGCDEAKSNKDYFKNIIVTSAKKQGLNLEASSEDTPEDYLLNLTYKNIDINIDLDECSEISTQLKKPEVNLDEIYGVIKYGFST